jgi:hypothetical protein
VAKTPAITNVFFEMAGGGLAKAFSIGFGADMIWQLEWARSHVMLEAIREQGRKKVRAQSVQFGERVKAA